MKEVVLAPIRETTSDYDDIEKEIAKVFREELYLPLLEEFELTKKTLQNSRDDLLEALRTGRVYFYRGQFTGTFRASISRELKALGAEWDRTQGSWKIPLSKLPFDVKSAISLSEARFSQKLSALDKKLQKILPEEITDKLKVEKFFDKTLFKVDKSFQKNIDKITVAPELTPERRAKIAEEYTNNLKLYIKDFTEKEIVELRKKIQDNVYSGNRYENLIKMIQKSYDVSLNKAKFLARQETSLMMTKFKEVRYKEAGVNEYIWATVVGSPAHPVRPMHKALAGKRFSWDNPPITDEKGNRNNPGQDYNCRCFAKPVVKF